MQKLLIVVRFALITPISARWVPQAAALTAGVASAGWGQTNSQWNTMGEDEQGWLTTSTDGGGDGPQEG
jgi:hypothetical protein